MWDDGQCLMWTLVMACPLESFLTTMDVSFFSFTLDWHQVSPQCGSFVMERLYGTIMHSRKSIWILVSMVILVWLIYVCCTENPYDVADQWLANEELPAGYREQVVQFILQNTGSTAAPPQFDPAFVDPYTGGKSLSIISASISYTICNPMVAVALLEELDTLMSITAK